jgi:DNA repair protein RadC
MDSSDTQQPLFTGAENNNQALVAKDSSNLKIAYIPSRYDEQAVIDHALQILEARLKRPEVYLRSPGDIKNYARLKIGDRDREVFGVFWLDSNLGVIGFDEMFQGTLTQTSVYPKEIVISALKNRANSVIFTHNHPSGGCLPSRADEQLTSSLKTVLSLVDVRVLDHIIVSAHDSYSMAEKGLL